MVEVNPPLSAASSGGPTPVQSAQLADDAFAEQWAKAQSAAGPASPTQLPSGDEDDNPLAPPSPPMPPGTTSAPAPVGPSSADVGSASGAAEAGESGAAALLTALGISPALSRIIKEARRFVPPGATLQVLSTEPGRFRTRFAGGPTTAGPSPVVTLGSATPTATGIDMPTPPAPPLPPNIGGADATGPPPPPPIPPDEIPFNPAPAPDDESVDDSPLPAQSNAAVMPPSQSAVQTAYRLAQQGELNWAAAPSRVRDEAVDEQA